MSKHTGGRWTRCWGDAKQIINIETSDSGNDLYPVATLKGCDREANADLICAAPDMLSQLELILTRLDMEPVSAIFPCSAMRDDIRRVIAKARGLPAPSREAWILRTHRGDYLSAVTDRLVVTQNRELAYSFDSEADAEDQAELAIHLGVFHPLRIR